MRTVLFNVGFGLEHGKVGARRRDQIARDALTLVGLPGSESDIRTSFLAANVNALLWRARWQLILMGEPFSAVDALTREALQAELAGIHAATHKTIIFVTRSITEALYLANEVVAITGKPGRLAALIAIDAPRPRGRDDPASRDIIAQLRAPFAKKIELLGWGALSSDPVRDTSARTPFDSRPTLKCLAVCDSSNCMRFYLIVTARCREDLFTIDSPRNQQSAQSFRTQCRFPYFSDHLDWISK